MVRSTMKPMDAPWAFITRFFPGDQNDLNHFSEGLSEWICKQTPEWYRFHLCDWHSNETHSMATPIFKMHHTNDQIASSRLGQSYRIRHICLVLMPSSYGRSNEESECRVTLLECRTLSSLEFPNPTIPKNGVCTSSSSIRFIFPHTAQ